MGTDPNGISVFTSALARMARSGPTVCSNASLQRGAPFCRGYNFAGRRVDTWCRESLPISSGPPLRVTQCPSDRNGLAANLEAIAEQVGKPAAVVTDSGYACQQEVEKVQSEEIEVHVSARAESRHQHRRRDFPPSKRRSESPKRLKADWLKKMKEEEEEEAMRARG